MSYKEMEFNLKAVGEETRLQIISYLSVDTFCVCELVELLKMSQPSISQHLKRLKDAKIINEEKRGKWNFYSLNKDHNLYPLILHMVSILPPFNQDIKNFTRVLCE